MAYAMVNNLGALESEIIAAAKALDELARSTYREIKKHNPNISEEELALCCYGEGLRSAVLAETLKSLIDKWEIIDRERERVSTR